MRGRGAGESGGRKGETRGEEEKVRRMKIPTEANYLSISASAPK